MRIELLGNVNTLANGKFVSTSNGLCRDLSRKKEVSNTRAKQITAGAFVAEAVMRNLDIDELEICPWALREGIVLKWLGWVES